MTSGRLLPVAAWGAAVLAAGHAAWSVYWTAGGTALLDTVGGSVEEAARRGGAAAVAVGAVTVALKLVGVLLALALVRPWGERLPRRLLERVATGAGALLALYGGVLVVVGAVALTGAVGEPADPRALRWHVLLWDPWFLLWGLFLTTAAVVHRRGAGTPDR
ncbi:DUF3995 domain-containing protein [Blastococcus sp. TF02A-26]|uniref:DUF3995 domain-containing protein n=1 Tax=Blastococcus sp. TF02A-26 TaxID=2250577 RepID=UPI000DEB6828|nr:DUF3995 domain-containing protein [Blastococcus sp. TF02A-26]RBY85308.1 DUF3995 domain-containing protein [Blastococcus sp. TF02A-26]